jgi:hypothetical protein
MLNRLKNHWFGALMTLITLVYATVIILIALAPRQDRQERGFIPCTKQMMTRLLACEKNRSLCMSKVIVQNHLCDWGVVAKGLTRWIQGEQARPWSNYLFEPDLRKDPDFERENAALLEEYYQNNPDVEVQMHRLNDAREQLETQLSEMKENESELPK